MKTKRNALNSIAAIILGSSILLLTSSVNAQNPQKQRPPKINHEQIVSQLNLDETTQQSLLQLMNDHRSQHEGQRNEDHKNNRDMREKHRADVKSLLGEEKFADFEKVMWMQRRDRKQRPEPGNRGE